MVVILKHSTTTNNRDYITEVRVAVRIAPYCENLEVRVKRGALGQSGRWSNKRQLTRAKSLKEKTSKAKLNKTKQIKKKNTCS